MSEFPSKFLRAQQCTITSKTFTELTEYGMNTEVAKRGNPHKWRIEFRTPPLWSNDARELQAFLDSLDGRYGTFTLPSPLLFMGTTKSFNVDNNALAGLASVDVGGLDPSDVNAIKGGNFIKFDNHDKVYKITKSVGSDVGGKATINIYPRLFANVIASEGVTNAIFTLRMTKDDLSLSLNATQGLQPVLITAIES